MTNQTTKQAPKTMIIPLGGMGTRMFPATHALPKGMLQVSMKPLIQYAVEETDNAGIENIIIAAPPEDIALYKAHFKLSDRKEKGLESKSDEIKDRSTGATDLYEQIIFVETSQNTAGVCDTILQCKDHLSNDEGFGVFFPDDLIDTPDRGVMAQMVDAYINHTEADLVLAGMEVPTEDISKYGIVSPLKGKTLSGAFNEISGIMEKPSPETAPSNMATVGRYIFPEGTVDALDQLRDNHGQSSNEINITMLIETLMNNDKHAYIKEFVGTRYDCGDHIGFVTAQGDFSASYLKQHAPAPVPVA